MTVYYYFMIKYSTLISSTLKVLRDLPTNKDTTNKDTRLQPTKITTNKDIIIKIYFYIFIYIHFFYLN
jgi:hypothetical protein